MKAAKRVLAIALAMILALAVFAFPASAIDGVMTFKIETAEEVYSAGDSVTVNVYVSSDFNATCMRIPVLYSSDIFELPAGNDVRITAYGTCLEKKGSLDVNTDQSSTPIDLFNVTDYYDASSYGIVAIQWTASITSSAINSFSTEEGVEPVKCFSFQLKVKEGASGEGTILIPAAEELKPAFAFYNQTVTNPADATTICRVNATFTVDSWTIEVAEGSQDDITTFPDSDVIIDRANKILKNWEEGVTKAVIQANVTTIGNAQLSYKANSSGAYGTGAKVRVFGGANMDLLGEYSVLIYGDLNGDGNIKLSDSQQLSKHLAGVIDLEEDGADPAFALAADVDCSGAIKLADSQAISKHLAGVADINQAA